MDRKLVCWCIFALTISRTARLVLNGHDRFASRDRNYFTRVQVWQHHTGGGLNPAAGAGKHLDSLAVYSFALEPEEHNHQEHATSQELTMLN